MKNDLTISVQMPAKAVVRAMLERCLDALPELDEVLGEAAAPRPLPAIGSAYEGGLYAGITVHDNAPHALILLPGEFKGDWKTSLDWAKKEDGELPSRFDALVLFKNLKGEFKEEWYWTREQRASGPSYAWFQSFDNGLQGYDHTDYGYRARAVRRIAI